MTYLYVYLAIGVVTLIVVLASHLLTKSTEVDELANLLLEVDPDRKKWWWKLLHNFVAPLLAGVFIVIVWPAAFIMKAKDLMKARGLVQVADAEDVEPKQKEFTVDREALIKRLSLGEVEVAETISDPLDGAPKLPFGHLNKAWNEYSAQLNGGELWRFSAQWTSDWGRREKREGYVIVRGEEIGPYFLTKWLPLGEAN